MAQILLHGTLHATIYEIDKLKGGFGQNLLHKVNLAVLSSYIRCFAYHTDHLNCSGLLNKWENTC